MTLSGFELRLALKRQTAAVELRDGRGFVRGTISAAAALDHIREHAGATFVGIGTTAGIRYLRPETSTRAGLIAEDCVTVTGRDTGKQHHQGRCAAYGPEQDRDGL